MFKKVIFFVTLTIFNPIQFTFAAQDFAHIQSMAILADAAYLERGALEAETSDSQTSSSQIVNELSLENALQEAGQKLIHHTTIPESQVSYFISQSNGVQTISIRGTANLENALLDLNVSLQNDDVLNIMLHQGFASAAKAVYNDVKPYLDKNQPIQTTGHSLGGAIAVILAMYLEQDNYPLSQVITFGQPKVTNVTGANQFSNLSLVRVVTLNDIVPLVPPISPLQIKNLDIYWHMGEEVILMKNNEYAQTNGVKSMLRATKFVSAIPSEKNLIAHKMITYLALIKEQVKSPNEVPYKTNISLFGISFD
ncbi:galactose-1-phosphate uridylyltransferase [Marinomonas ushuaiensis DSM 15871]|uniref:Galactose-1-phosphate uridylyltransferase n=1 Tax=Marinomonas ushuaiensis DSM 15871 TaxID=1122207 RepID=X7E6T8_9GAMM|nr:lipase family protein [Marinomonas ushuaiensis]ETX11575.1 galactose-1-phosphate uridylyltransferase [Marinomonas ushuaiensis DSM 15871]